MCLKFAEGMQLTLFRALAYNPIAHTGEQTDSDATSSLFLQVLFPLRVSGGVSIIDFEQTMSAFRCRII